MTLQHEPSWQVFDDDCELVLKVDDKTYATITRWSDTKTKEHCWFSVERLSDGKSLGLHVRFEKACQAATDDAGVTLAPPADLVAEWEDLPQEPSRASIAEPASTFTNVQFAKRATGIAAIAAKWARDILDSSDDVAKPYQIAAFCSEISERLDHLKETAAR